MLYIATQRQHKSTQVVQRRPEGSEGSGAGDLARDLGLSRATMFRMIRLLGATALSGAEVRSRAGRFTRWGSGLTRYRFSLRNLRRTY